ncbi:methylmalonyl Co-A mutase-associated GTPase MeaB [Zunongwangia sp. SCSIO 43204]|uniref:methylmalonyl Co-A mutase-associated GTPase MeaB n=1 Tax=Zunongwangia sp. SCSIO 43204 TaxID=2779359 RepID=UPI001CA9A2AF|nr:methylmalonyl Co-A mutase-associated GTPase MeaB [Zunongwangia sp. SCSIO 43204]UAB86140.1 methylmalonyl Co-A mutase-associated GTPase MeaB [Zunongwangia sp. SCSIO 43204]
MKKPSKKSAISQSHSIPASANVSSSAAEKIKLLRKKKQDHTKILDRLLQGSQTALGQAITLVESNNPTHQEQASAIIEGAIASAGKSIRIGITGVPGVGKSTFIESFGSHLLKLGKKVAVLAVDPSSSISKGSILGDKTRMENLVKEEMAFIRPSPSGDSLGGVARKTRESIMLCEAAGFDVILIETVGVGQSETTVHSMCDFFLLLKLAGAGDELQGIKRGIMEMADAIVINKADGDNIKAANTAKLDFKRALHLYPPKESSWTPEVLLSSALYNEGIPEIWNLIRSFEKKTLENGYFEENRKQQSKFWLLQSINEQLKQSFYQNPEIKTALEEQLQAIFDKKTSPFIAAKQLLEKYSKL